MGYYIGIMLLGNWRNEAQYFTLFLNVLSLLYLTIKTDPWISYLFSKVILWRGHYLSLFVEFWLPWIDPSLVLSRGDCPGMTMTSEDMKAFGRRGSEKSPSSDWALVQGWKLCAPGTYSSYESSIPTLYILLRSLQTHLDRESLSGVIERQTEWGMHVDCKTEAGTGVIPSPIISDLVHPSSLSGPQVRPLNHAWLSDASEFPIRPRAVVWGTLNAPDSTSTEIYWWSPDASLTFGSVTCMRHVQLWWF